MQPVPALSPRPSTTAWSILILLSISTLGCYYLFDFLVPLVEDLQKKYGWSDVRIAILGTSFSAASTLPILAAGKLVDRYRQHTRALTLIFSGFCLAGAALMLWGEAQKSVSFNLMLAGRFLCGFGVESLLGAVTIVVYSIFSEQTLGFALGLNLAFARLGSLLALLGTLPNWNGESHAFELAVIAGALCVSGVIAFMIMAASSRAELDPIAFDRVENSQIGELSKSFWTLAYMCATFYGAFFAFDFFSQHFLIAARRATEMQASYITASIYAWSIPLSPILGTQATSTDNCRKLMASGILALVSGLVILRFTQWNPYLPAFLIGIAISAFAAGFWPDIAFQTPKKIRGTGYAILTVGQHIAVVITTLLSGELSGAQHNDSMLLIAALTFAAMALLPTLVFRSQAGAPSTPTPGW